MPREVPSLAPSGKAPSGYVPAPAPYASQPDNLYPNNNSNYAPAGIPVPPISPVAVPQNVPQGTAKSSDEQTLVVIEQLRDQVSQLQSAIMNIGDSCSSRADQATDPTEQQKNVQDLTAENEKLAQTKSFLVAQNKEFIEKNNFLRQSEKTNRLQVEGQQQKIEQLQAQIKELEAKRSASPTQRAQQGAEIKTPVTTSISALPEGWRIIGLCPTLVSLENPNKQVTVLLAIGEKIEGVEIKGINFAQNTVLTSNGVAKYTQANRK